MAGRIIHLVGTSSVGKSSIARAIQLSAAVPWLAFSTDTLITAMPPQWLADGAHAEEGRSRSQRARR